MRFTFAHVDETHGYYVSAENVKEAEEKFALRCAEESLNWDDYLMSEICDGPNEIWNMWKDIPLPEDVLRVDGCVDDQDILYPEFLA